MTEKRGFFIVLEGIDGSGTTTQAAKLHNYLNNKGLESHLTNEPTSGPVGTLIREALSGRLIDESSGERIRFTEAAQSLLFAADRIEHSVEIAQHCGDGAHVISDRYVHSSIAYQSIDPSISPERVIEVNGSIAMPDLTLFLDVPVDVCLARLGDRDDSPSIYEKKDLLDKIDDNYRRTMKLYETRYGRVVTIDGTRPVSDVHMAIVGAVNTTIAG